MLFENTETETNVTLVEADLNEENFTKFKNFKKKESVYLRFYNITTKLTLEFLSMLNSRLDFRNTEGITFCNCEFESLSLVELLNMLRYIKHLSFVDCTFSLNKSSEPLPVCDNLKGLSLDNSYLPITLSEFINSFPNIVFLREHHSDHSIDERAIVKFPLLELPSKLTLLDLQGKTIAELSSKEFASLLTLRLVDCTINSDLSLKDTFPNLKELDIENCVATKEEFNLTNSKGFPSRLKKLWILGIKNANLNLDISNLSELKHLVIMECYLNTLDTSSNTDLKFLQIEKVSALSQLDLKNNMELKNLALYLNNNLTEVILSEKVVQKEFMYMSEEVTLEELQQILPIIKLV